MQVVLFDSGVSASDYSSKTPDAPVDDVVIQRTITGAEHTTEHIAYGFMAESDNHILLFTGDGNFILVAIGIIVYGLPNYGASCFQTIFFIVLVVLVSALHFCNRTSGDDLGMEAFCQFCNALHDTLHIDDHSLQRSGDDGKFLLQIITGNRNTMAHQNFVGSTAYSA